MNTQERKSYLKSRKPAAQVVNNLLGPDERILWQGLPVARYAFWSGVRGNTWAIRMAVILGMLIAIQPFSLFGFYWVYVSTRAIINTDRGASLALSAAGIGLGLLLALGPYTWAFRSGLRAYQNARHVHYVITNHRVMVLMIKEGRLIDERIKSLNAITPRKVTMLNSKGVGHVIFDTDGAFHSGGDGGSDYVVSHDVGFESVATAREVMALLEKAVADHRK
jgi:hypothetical protein